MTDESYRWQPSAGPPTGRIAPAPPGWYPDPWASGQHRYWDGSAWTGGSFPHGPADPSPEGRDWSAPPPSAVAPPPGGDRFAPPPPEWARPTQQLWTPPPPPDPWQPAPVAPLEPSKPAKKAWWRSGVGFVALVLAIMLLVGSLGTLGGYLVFRHRSSSTSTASGPVPTLPTVPGGRATSPPRTSPPGTSPSDRSASALAGIVLQQTDVPSTILVQPIQGGDRVAGQPTLDLCNGTFASESLRTARLQVAAYDGQATELLSTEAVLYGSAAASEQAFAELKSVAAQCPSKPVVSPVGEATVTTRFNPAPDTAWAQTPSVTRQAYDFVTDDGVGDTEHSIAVYLRRGRVLMGVYFSHPDSPQITVAGQSTIEKIVAVFANRIAALPASVVNG